MTDQPDEWELSKENVQPLRQGRKFSCLTAALQPEAGNHMSTQKQEKDVFETELRTYSGDDPLQVWYRYLQWTEQAYIKGGKDSSLVQLMERCLKTFKGDPRYQNDQRYVTTWIKYANMCKDPQEIFNFVHDQGIGNRLACFYEAWAWAMEQVGNTKRADLIYQEGIKNFAQPVDLLEKRHGEFQVRVVRGSERMEDDSYQGTGLGQEQRSVLGSLRSTGKHGKVGTNRTGLAKLSNRGGLGLKGGLGLGQSGQNFQVFNDENQAPQSLLPGTREWSEVPRTSTLNKENEKKPGVWTKAKISQKTGAIPISAVNSYSRPSFTVHVEENADQSMLTPRKPPEVGKQVLSAHKPDKMHNPLSQVCQSIDNDPLQKPMYCKDKVYCGITEYSFEELRAARWSAKKKKEEEKRRLEEEKREMEAHREEIMRQRQQLLEDAEKMRLEQMAFQKEHQMMIEQCKQHMLMQKAQFDNERQLHLQRQQELLEKDIQTRLAQQLSVSSTSPREKPLLSMDTSLPTGHSTNSTDQQDGVCQKRDITTARQLVYDGLTTGVLQSQQPNTQDGHNVSNHQTASASASSVEDPLENSKSHTPSNLVGSHCQNSVHPTPESRRSLAAPSPTVTTKEAMQLVMGMFNASLEIEKQVEWTEDLAESSLSETRATKVTSQETTVQNSGMKFTIFDETEEKPPPPTSTNIFVDKENIPDENSFKLPSQLPAGHRRRGLGGVCQQITQQVETTDNDALKPQIGLSMIHHDQTVMEYDNATGMDGIESQARDDFTIAPVGSHLSFAAAARIASTPYNPNNSSGKFANESQMFDAKDEKSIIQDKTSLESNAFQLTENDPCKQEANLSPIMEGSNEDSLENQTCRGQSDYSLHQPNPLPVNRFDTDNQYLALPTEHLNNQSVHMIDTSGYVAPELDEKTEALLSMSIRIDPHNPFDEDTISQFLKMLPRPLHLYPNYIEIQENIKEVKLLCLFDACFDMYTIEKLLGKGGYAEVYKASTIYCDFDCESCALKIQRPPNKWEFYICSELQERLGKLSETVDMRPCMLSVIKGYFFLDASCLVTKCYNHGSLLDYVNTVKTDETLKPFPESIAAYITIELLHIVEKLHKCQIIHGDIKPDNFLFGGLPFLEYSTDPDIIFGKSKHALTLIDFGQSIDMTKYPPGTTFMSKVNTDSFQCIEMKTDRPWTYQTDLFGLVGTIHVVVFGQYMKIFQCKTNSMWNMTSSFNRGWNGSLWKKLFQSLLNIASCEELPDLTALRCEFEQHFTQNLLQDYMRLQRKMTL